jgi:hypothetical protein
MCRPPLCAADSVSSNRAVLGWWVKIVVLDLDKSGYIAGASCRIVVDR